MPTALVVGTSRGLGLALTLEFLDRGWRVVATVRGEAPEALRERAAHGDGRLVLERVDLTDEDGTAALHERLRGERLDLLFVNGAITRGDLPIGEVPREMFVEVMVTNAWAPMRFVERFADLVPAGGTIAVMSSRQGSVSFNTRGGQELYRASKSALNQLMRSFAARHGDDPRALLLLNPGHVATDLGGPSGSVPIGESVPGVVDTVLAHAGEPGLRFLDWRGETVPW